jgi:hypothetical protein
MEKNMKRSQDGIGKFITNINTSAGMYAMKLYLLKTPWFFSFISLSVFTKI